MVPPPLDSASGDGSAAFTADDSAALSVGPAGAHYGAREAALARVLRVAAGAFDAPFAQLVPLGDGPTLSHGALGDAIPDLQALGARMPPGAALIVVEDAARDARFDGVLPEGARFFAWAVLPSDAGEEGAGPAALAVLDVRPHPATPGERLLDIAAVAGDLLRTVDAAGSAEARWVEAEARFQALGDLVSDAVVIADADGAVLDANDRAAALLGCEDPDELVGRPLEELAPGGDGATVQTVERAVPFEGKELRLAVLRSGIDP